MPASHIDASVRQFAPEPVLAWCNGQSLESRYSSSVGGGGGAALGKLAGNAVLRHQLGKAQLPDAVRMPRLPVIAAGAAGVYIFDGPAAKRGPFATLSREQVQVHHHRGPMWQRLDLIVPGGDRPLSYTMMVLGTPGARKRLRALTDELTRASSAT